MTGDPPVVVACDESGAEGERLIGGNTVVFAHAGVTLSVEEASACIRRLRELIRSPATEYKANHLLRSKNRSSLEWFLGPGGPVHGRAHVCLVEKAFFLLVRFAETLVRAAERSASGTAMPGPSAGQLAEALYREGPGMFGRKGWSCFLQLLNNQMRSPSLREPLPSPDGFFHLAEMLGAQGRSGAAHDVWNLVRRHQPCPQALTPPDTRRQPAVFPALDPLGPAIEWAFARWSDGGALTVVHDQQTTLTSARIARIEQLCGGTLRLVPSASDPRVQVADFLAGVARKLATDELVREADTELAELLRPYIDPRSVWRTT